MNKEITQAFIELKQAEQNFNYATQEFVNTATMQLIAAEMKVDTLLNLKKQNGPTQMDPWVSDKSLTKLFKDIVPQQEQIIKREIKVQSVNFTHKPGKHLMSTGKNF